MLTSKGAAVRTKAGERITYKIGPQDNAGAIARRLTLQIHRMVRARERAGGVQSATELSTGWLSPNSAIPPER